MTSVFPRSTAAALAFTLLAGCGKAPQSPAPEATPAHPDSKQAVVEQTSFEAVAKHLDPNGGVYAYLSTEAFFQSLNSFGAKIREMVETDAGLTPAQQKQAQEVFGVLRALLDESGLREISGAGFSSIAIRPGVYRTRAVLHHPANAGSGFFWKLNGGQATALDWVAWLPEKTSAAGSADFTLEPLREALAKALGANETLRPQWAQMEAQVQAATGLSLAQILSGVGPALSYVVTLDPQAPFTIPRQAAQGEPMTIPEPRVALMFELRDEALLQWVQGRLALLPDQPAPTQEDGWTVQRLNAPIPLPFLSPVVAWTKDRLLITTNEPLFREMLAVRAGRQPGLAATAAFKEAMEGLPAPASSFGYVTPLFHQTVAAVQMRSVNNRRPQRHSPGEGFYRLVQSFQPQHIQAGVGQTTPEGVITVTNGGVSPAQVATVAAAAPVALVAALAAPGFAKGRKEAARGEGAAASQAEQTLEQLRLLDAAVDQWALEHRKAPGAQATTDDLKPYLKAGTPLFRLLEAHPGATAVPLVPDAPPVAIPPVDGKLTLPPEAQAKIGPVPEGFWGPYGG